MRKRQIFSLLLLYSSLSLSLKWIIFQQEISDEIHVTLKATLSHSFHCSHFFLHLFRSEKRVCVAFFLDNINQKPYFLPASSFSNVRVHLKTYLVCKLSLSLSFSACCIIASLLTTTLLLDKIKMKKTK